MIHSTQNIKIQTLWFLYQEGLALKEYVLLLKSPKLWYQIKQFSWNYLYYMKEDNAHSKQETAYDKCHPSIDLATTGIVVMICCAPMQAKWMLCTQTSCLKKQQLQGRKLQTVTINITL